ncbi:arylsulfatase A-like enzyme [Roseimicrobium gellanilyticum]|uniref:Arylsulfatase A-like enzyme n=1 Tax=Roseimicrobium gellanilyticum TaxID=748857 RepID=A0A366HTD1_9BACT|nr:sulfatase [Roseimicrobium gellanilyticum]RBP46183.1 arylsulfatase A-like enzyme [Roseimicrobium gellanilyticum]
MTFSRRLLFSYSLVVLAGILPAFGQSPAGAPASAPAAAPATRPNVLIVLCDDLRADHLSVTGHPHLKTPNIDRVAKEGVLFQNAFCTTSLCSPSRASILSGLYAHKHGVRDNFTEFPAEIPNLPKRLQDAGYETGYVGKWHMGEDNDEKRPGFDYWASHKGQGKYFDTEFNVEGERKVIPGYYTTVATDLATNFIKKDHAGKPWFLVLGQKAPHSFYTPEEKYKHTFDEVRVPYPKSAFMLDDKPAWYKDRLYTWHGIYGPLFEWRKEFPNDKPEAVRDFENMIHGYWGVIQSLDDSMATLLRVLQEKGELDKTIIVFMGDNGLLNGENGMVDKRAMHDASIRIPILVRYPGLVPSDKAKVVTQQVLTLDMAPSLLELCGAEALPNIHGKSWVKLVKEGDKKWRKGWFYEYNYEKQFPYTPNVRGVRTDDWKYIHYPHGDDSEDRHMAELYDLKNDPGETKNLINASADNAKLRELQVLMAKLMDDAGLAEDKMPIDEGVKKELPDQKIR